MAVIKAIAIVEILISGIVMIALSSVSRQASTTAVSVIYDGVVVGDSRHWRLSSIDKASTDAIVFLSDAGSRGYLLLAELLLSLQLPLFLSD